MSTEVVAAIGHTEMEARCNPSDAAAERQEHGWSAMEIHPTPDQQAFIRSAIEAGRIARPEDAATQAMALWEERERRRLEILSRVDDAEASLARGEGVAITQVSMRQLAADVKQRGRDRMAEERQAGR